MYEIHVEENKKVIINGERKGGGGGGEGKGGKKSLEIFITNRYYSFILNLFDSRRNCCTVKKMSSF